MNSISSGVIYQLVVGIKITNVIIVIPIIHLVRFFFMNITSILKSPTPPSRWLANHSLSLVICSPARVSPCFGRLDQRARHVSSDAKSHAHIVTSDYKVFQASMPPPAMPLRRRVTGWRPPHARGIFQHYVSLHEKPIPPPDNEIVRFKSDLPGIGAR